MNMLIALTAEVNNEMPIICVLLFLLHADVRRGGRVFKAQMKIINTDISKAIKPFLDVILPSSNHFISGST